MKKQTTNPAMENRSDSAKEAMIQYIVNLLRGASTDKVRKLFICATNILR